MRKLLYIEVWNLQQHEFSDILDSDSIPTSAIEGQLTKVTPAVQCQVMLVSESCLCTMILIGYYRELLHSKLADNDLIKD